ncbi:MAG: ZIP family metal transporter [Candidatus Lokiarchaeota archaeon]|nr:ZIP family metal transporter [Candidatus Lokiarchaeota archaeon]
MIELLYIILSTIVISLLSIIGIVTIGVDDKKLNKIILLLVALSAGGLIGGAFLHLLPEAIHESESLSPLIVGEEGIYVYLIVIAGYLLFFLIEKILDWHHCHNVEEEHICEFHSFKWLNLIGDGVHNFLDGLIIATSFLVNWNLGIITTIAVIFHEIPQEIGDYGVLVYGGFSKKKALYLNFLTALTAIIGGILGYFIIGTIEIIKPFLLAFAAGGFIYIAASDLLPELKKEHSGRKITLLFFIVIGGILLMFLMKILFHG